jgi:hypothetical protein
MNGYRESTSMILRDTITGELVEAGLDTDPTRNAPETRNPVLCVLGPSGGCIIDQQRATLYRVVSATADEWEEARRAGFHLDEDGEASDCAPTAE